MLIFNPNRRLKFCGRDARHERKRESSEGKKTIRIDEQSCDKIRLATLATIVIILIPCKYIFKHDNI